MEDLFKFTQDAFKTYLTKVLNRRLHFVINTNMEQIGEQINSMCELSCVVHGFVHTIVIMGSTDDVITLKEIYLNNIETIINTQCLTVGTYAVTMYADVTESTLICYYTKGTSPRVLLASDKPYSGKRDIIYLRLVEPAQSLEQIAQVASNAVKFLRQY